jgi:hypothetical protein
VMDKDR